MPAIRFFAVLIALLGLLSGCSPAWPHRYETLAPHVAFQGFGKAIVLTRDQRPAVKNGETRPQHVGTVRSVAGDSYEIVTATGHPLAQDVSTAVCNALVGKGFECIPLISGQGQVADELDYLQQTYTPARVLFITIDDWDSSVYMSTTLRYDLGLKVYNSTGETMVSVSAAGAEKLGGVAPFNPARYASQAVPHALEEILQTLLGHEQVKASMNMVRSIDALGARYR